ncbi:MAG: hypothetical protein ACRDLB_01970 [Actinomycetota bacterium]
MPRNLNHSDPLRRLRAIAAMEHKIRQDKLAAFREAIEQGRTFGQIAAALGITRQGARRWWLRNSRGHLLAVFCDSLFSNFN